jgi:putative tricarboxylic transport membrane protein
MVPVGLAFGRGMAKVITKIPLSLLAPTVIFLTMVGSYCVSNSISDVYTMLILGLLGFVLRKLGFEAGPITLGLILGPIIESGLVQGLLIGRKLPQPWLIFITRPICWVFIVLSVFFLLWPVILKKRIVVSGGDQK